jgi:hypothetical protein
MSAKVKDILSKVEEDFRVNMYSNGYMLEVSGRDSKDEWASAKIICNNVEELITLIKETTTLPRT